MRHSHTTGSLDYVPGFMLAELSAAAAVIAISAAILLPTPAECKESARREVCVLYLQPELATSMFSPRWRHWSSADL